MSILEDIGSVLLSKDFRKVVCGTYSNGKIRSFSDAFHGETLSPKKRGEIDELLLTSKNKKKKKKKKKSKHNKKKTYLEL